MSTEMYNVGLLACLPAASEDLMKTTRKGAEGTKYRLKFWSLCVGSTSPGIPDYGIIIQ
jgi:hypothetical protein